MTGSLQAVPKPATGTIQEHRWADGETVSYYLRVRARGDRHRLLLGTNHEGWSRARAQVELDRVMAQVRRGTWEPPTTARAATLADDDETVHHLLARWWRRRQPELSTRTVEDYEWRISHVLAYFARTPVAAVDAREVDDFRIDLQDRLGPRSVNMVLGLLAQVLDDAVRYGMLPANPARGKGTRVKEPRKTRLFLEPDMVVDLLEEAGRLERAPRPRETVPRPGDRWGQRALLATLTLAGPRIAEALRAERGRLDVHAGAWTLGLKTEAGTDRRVELTAFLLGELRAHLAAVPARLGRDLLPGDPVFCSATGGRLNASNVRNRLIADTVAAVNEARARDGRAQLPPVTPHLLRRTFASLCGFAGRDIRWVMSQLGHADARMTLGVYQQTMERRKVDAELVWRLMAFPDELDAGPPAFNRRSAHR